MEKRHNRLIPFMVAIFLLLLSLSACSYPSAERRFGEAVQKGGILTGGGNLISETAPSGEGSTATMPLKELIPLAVETNRSSPLLQKFWFSGWVSNTVEKRKVNSMYRGVVLLPHGYYAEVRMAGTPYRYYKWDDYKFMWTEKEDWMVAGEEQFPLDPFFGFDWWVPVADRATPLPDEKILNRRSNVFEIKLSGEEMIRLHQAPFFPEELAKISATPDGKGLLRQIKVTATFWIGDDTYTKEEIAAQAKKAGAGDDEKSLDRWVRENRLIWDEKGKVYHQHPIYQYRVLIDAPVPKAGYMNQEIFFRFYHYNDPGIKIQTPEEILKFVKDGKKEG